MQRNDEREREGGTEGECVNAGIRKERVGKRKQKGEIKERKEENKRTAGEMSPTPLTIVFKLPKRRATTVTPPAIGKLIPRRRPREIASISICPEDRSDLFAAACLATTPRHQAVRTLSHQSQALYIIIIGETYQTKESKKKAKGKRK